MSALRTARLSLTPLDPGHDAPGLHAGLSDPDILHWWGNPSWAELAGTQAGLAKMTAHEGARLWTIRERGQPEPLGVVGLITVAPVPLLTWALRKTAWGSGFASEAAAAVVEHAFESLGLPRVEAWVEAGNVSSLAVARRIGLTERGRLAQRHPHRAAPHENIVLGRSRAPEPTTVLDVELILLVTDVSAHVAILQALVGAELLFRVGVPPRSAGLRLSPWSIGPRVRLVQTDKPPPVVTLILDVGAEFEAVHARAIAVGVEISQPPAVQLWENRREFTLRLPDGHRLVLTAPAG